MRAIILVGGRGLRLRPLTLNTPKPIVPVLNQPLLLYQIKLLKKLGITDISLSSYYLPQKLRDVLGNGENWGRSEEHTSELQSRSFISYAVFCLKKKTTSNNTTI